MSHPTYAAPSDPIAAATHPDPYPYYAQLVAERPWYRDARLQLWVASGAQVVAQVLASEICHVRPAAEPVPRALADGACAAIFRHLVRMNDGAAHCPFKQAITSALHSLDGDHIAAALRQRAAVLSSELQPRADPAALTRFMLALPVQTLAMLLGVPAVQITAVGECVAAFVAAIGPLATATDIEQGDAAAATLLELFRGLLAAPASTLLNVLAREAACVGRDAQNLIVANGIGLMSQSLEATAGLIGNTLLALARRADLLSAVRRTPALLSPLVQRVLYSDPPTQSTRRFVVRSGSIAGSELQAGETILVMLAAAGRDPSAQPCPESLDPHALQPVPGNFGVGVHACPASRLATLIAEHAIAHLLAEGLEPAALAARCSYRRSNHLRLPLFG